jgi:hypothetical protein
VPGNRVMVDRDKNEARPDIPGRHQCSISFCPGSGKGWPKKQIYDADKRNSALVGPSIVQKPVNASRK